MRSATLVTILPLAATLLTAVGCDGLDRREKLRSDFAPDRAEGIVASATAGDHSVVHRLVELLEDRDPAVRMYAILALKQLTGETYGYEYYAAETQRAAAVRRWRAALRRGEVEASAATAEAAETPAPTHGQEGV